MLQLLHIRYTYVTKLNNKTTNSRVAQYYNINPSNSDVI